MKSDEILDILQQEYPYAHCELNYDSCFQLLVAVVLSAQTSDAAVNKVTPDLFRDYGNAYLMSKASLSDIEAKIKKIGLYRNKAKSLLALSKKLVEDYDGIVPSDMKALMSLQGVGRKSAQVVRGVYFDIPSMPVDTHVFRIAKRLGFGKPDDSLLQVEAKLKRKIKRERWNQAHHLMIFFGRYRCFARNPKCVDCPLKTYCKKDKIMEKT